jgi:GH35 family endo-1,4-beta-xylanase
MKRHAFPFGSAVAADALLGTGPDNDKYRELVPKLFNRVVMENDLKWEQWEQNPERAKQGVAWLRERGIEVRGHTLVWPAWRWLPRDLPALKDDKAALSKRIRDHITGVVGAMRGQLVEWDVINEPYANHDLMDILGRDAMIDWFRLTKATDSKPRLFLNDYPPLDGAAINNAHLDHFYNTIAYLKQNGAPIEGIGFQGHFGAGVIPPTRVLSALDRFAAFGLPIAITEFDINTTDEALQADYTRDFYIACFSHPPWTASSCGASGKAVTGCPTPPCSAATGPSSPTARLTRISCSSSGGPMPTANPTTGALIARAAFWATMTFP